MFSQAMSLWRLRVVADPDPGAIARVLERFQNLNVLPRRVLAEFGTNGVLHIQVDVFGFPPEELRMIAAKIAQAPCIVSAYCHPA
jgi:hypothetical protein